VATFDRGDLNSGKTAISGTPVREEDWNLEMTGNWSGYVQKTAGSTDLDQDRTHNAVNEITDISETTGTAWATPVHDRAGNMTSVPKPALLASSLSLKWDAWNRLVEARDGVTVIGVYEYDGLKRRVKRHVDSQSPGNPNGIDTYIHYFYNSAWQVLETRDTTTESDQPENLQPDWQYDWSLSYIDAPVLRDKNTDADGLCDDERIYYLGDANFNVTTLVDTSGDAVERYLYDAYGRGTVYDGAWANILSASSYANVVMYTGRERDAETVLYHYRHRYYAAELGRFVGRDPHMYADRWSIYLYTGASPIVFTDPFGLVRHHWFMKYWRTGDGQARVDAICGCPQIKIDNYTTEYTFEEHVWITNPHGGEVYTSYQRMYEGVLAQSKNCCQFLRVMLAMMLAWDFLVQRAHETGLLPDPVDPGHRFDLIRYGAAKQNAPSMLPDYLDRLCIACGAQNMEKTKNVVEIEMKRVVDLVERLDGMNATLFEKIIAFLTRSYVGAIPKGPCCGSAVTECLKKAG
jgi:RHS repeat-associated protein